MRRVWLLPAAAAAYLVAAWAVAPGFYDGFAPPQPYNFVCPPPQAGANNPPSSGQLTIKVINGVSDANSAFTDDGQLVIGFLPGAFNVTGKTEVHVTIKPVSPCPNPTGLHFSTNAYQVTADAPLVKSANLVMRYSNLAPDPSYVYRSNSADGPWTQLTIQQQAQLYTISTSVSTLGYFAAGYPSNAISSGGGGATGQNIVPIVVAALIVAVLLAGVPLTILRRRQARAGDDDDDE